MVNFVFYKIILLIVVSMVLCNNITGKYNSMKSQSFSSKQHRLLTFNTQDDGDISMELAFNVPFITIPVKKSIDMAKGAIANVNIGAVVLAGAIIFGFAVLIPGILILMTKTNSPNMRYRGEVYQQWWGYLNIFDQILTENNVDTTSCIQKTICWTVQNSAKNVAKGQSSSNDKIIDGIATSHWMQKILEGTVVYAAIQKGLSRTNCSEEYSQCKINTNSIKTFAQNLFI